MQRGFRVMTMSVLIAAASFAIHADATPQSQSGEIQLQLGHEFFAEGRYQDAIQAYQRSLTATVPDLNARSLRAKLTQPGRAFVWLKRHSKTSSPKSKVGGKRCSSMLVIDGCVRAFICPMRMIRMPFSARVAIMRTWSASQWKWSRTTSTLCKSTARAIFDAVNSISRISTPLIS